MLDSLKLLRSERTNGARLPRINKPFHGLPYQWVLAGESKIHDGLQSVSKCPMNI